MRFDPAYVSQVLNENFEDAKTLFLSPLMAIHYAHLIMLTERGVIEPHERTVAYVTGNGLKTVDALGGSAAPAFEVAPTIEAFEAAAERLPTPLGALA